MPEGAARHVVVFLPEADRAFLEEGASVRVELDQLPAGEFGSLEAKVVRIGADLATATEVSDALGAVKVDGPAYRVELVLDEGGSLRTTDKVLRPGSLVTARFVLRKRRLAVLVFEPLERFFE